MTTAETLPVVVIGAGPVGLAAGYEQVRSIAAHLAGDAAAAADLQLDLPETGVCSTPEIDAADGGSRCAAAAPRPVSTGTGPVGAGLGFAHGRSGSGSC